MKKMICLCPYSFFLLLSIVLSFSLPALVHAQPSFGNHIFTQDQQTDHGHCGLDNSFLLSLGRNPLPPGVQSLTVNNFPASAVITCGHFKLYYEDLAVGNGGFAEGGGLSGTIGMQRRNTLCAVINYLESVFDFSAMGSNQYIRLHVDQSFSPGVNPASGINYYAIAGPGYDMTPGVKNGFIYDFITSGTDPIGANDYHGVLKVNFDQTQSGTINYLNDYTSPLANCQLDLYSVLLHEMGHALGWLSLIAFTPTGGSNDFGQATLSPVISTGDIFTGMDFSMHQGTPIPLSFIKVVTGSIASPSLNPGVPSAVNDLWLNNLPTPRNHAVFSGSTYGGGWNDNSIFNSYGSHLDDQTSSFTMRHRISPGDLQEYVMGPFGRPGILRRTFTKGEIEGFLNFGMGSLGYTLNPAYQTANAAALSNVIPYSSRMSTYPLLYFSDEYYSHYMPADFTLVNNGTPLVINVNTDVTNVDSDPKSVMPGTLVNFRGCGDGGNNHNRLSVSTNGQTITYIPRPDFIGRAQFGFNLWDGTEQGAFVVYTIDVTPGTFPTYTAGISNLVLNGDYEEGSEVKTLANQLIPNSTFDRRIYEGKLGGSHLSDCHPYSGVGNGWGPYGGGDIIDDSYYECTQATSTTTGAGHITNGVNTTTFNFNIHNPQPAINGGERYGALFYGDPTPNWGSPTLYHLRSNMQTCKYYTIEYDVYSVTEPVVSLRFGFGDVNTITFPGIGAYTPVLNAEETFTNSIGAGNWVHVIQHFWYCSSSPSNILYIQNATAGASYPRKVLLDNVSIVEDLMPPPFSASISQSASTNPCLTTLTANAVNPACDVTYQWMPGGATTQSIDVPAGVTASYTVTVSDGCHSTNETIMVQGTGQCGPCTVFGNTPYIILGTNGTIPPGTYTGAIYIPPINNTTTFITLNGLVNFNNAVVLVDPLVNLDISPTSTVILNSSHFFSCNMWRGFAILTNGSTTGTLRIEGNSLIEDAFAGVISQFANNTGVGGPVLATNGAIFNRNLIGVNIDNFTSPITFYPFSFNNTVFTCRDFSTFPGYPFSWPTTTGVNGLKTPTTPLSPFDAPYAIDNPITYPFATCKNSLPAQTGIYLNTVGTVVSGSIYYEQPIGTQANGQNQMTNLFDNLEYGIRTYNSNFLSVNNVFTNIQSTNPALGNGIHSIGSQGSSYRVRAIPMGGNQGNTFYNCARAVYVRDHKQVFGEWSYIASKHTGNNGQYGYDIKTSNYDMIRLANNRMYNLSNGIYFGTNPMNMGYQANGPIDIYENTMDAHPAGTGSITTEWFGNAITLDRVSNCTNCVMSGWVMTYDNTLKNVYNGIKVNGFGNQIAETKSNIIELRTNGSIQSLQYGVTHAYCNNSRIRENSVKGFGHTSGGLKTGFLSDHNTGTQVNCNTAKNLGRGFEFDFTQANTRWIDNKMQDDQKGFVLSNGQIGTQAPGNLGSANIWTAVTSGFSWTGTNCRTYTYNVNPIMSRIYLNTATYTTCSNHGNNGVGAAYFKGGLFGTIRKTTNDINSPCTPPFILPPISTDLGVDLAQNLVTHTNDDNVGAFIAQYSLWKGLYDDPSLASSHPILGAFKNLGELGRFGMLAKIDSVLHEGDTTEAKNRLSDPNLMIPLPLTSPAPTTAALADDLFANKVIENYQKFYNIYIHYLGDYINSTDSVQLDSIAHLCPERNGTMVFQARALYNMAFDVKVFEDNCEIAGDENGNGEGEEDGGGSRGRFVNSSEQSWEIDQLVMQGQSYALVPNPNNGNFTIRQIVKDDELVSVDVWSAVGSTIYKDKVRFVNGEYSLSLGAIVAGNYLLHIVDSKGRQYTVKFTVL